MSSKRAWWYGISASLGVNTAIVLFNALLIGILWYAVFGLVRTERQDTIRAAIDRNDNLAIAFEQYTVRTLQAADAVTQYLIREYVGPRRTIDLAKFMAAYSVDNSAIIGVVLADEVGNALTTAYSRNLARPMNVADREHFRVHIERDSGRLFVGKPVLGRVTGQAVIPVTRRINKADGSFGGVAIALIEPARFTDVLDEAKLRPLDVISLVGVDGITRARLSGTVASWGEDISKSPLFAEQAKHPVGNLFARGQRDNVPRFFSYRTLPDYQVMTIVGAAEADVMAELYRRRNRYFWAAGLTSAFIAGFAVLLILAFAGQRRGAVAVARSELRFRQMAENIHDVFFLRDADTRRMLYVNPAYEEIWGRSCESLYANPESWIEAIHPDDRASTYEEYKKGVSAGKYVLEYRIVRPDGSIRWIEGRAFSIRDDAGKIVRITGVVKDITEHKRADQKFKELLESTPDAMVIINRDAAVVLVNSQAVKLFGWPREELLGQKIEILMSERFCGKYPGYLSAFFVQPRARAMGAGLELFALRKDGTEFPVEISLSPLETDEGTLVISAIRDVTERKKAQDRIEYLNRVYAMLSGISTLIVRVHDRDELFREACRIAVEQGKFRVAWIGVVDRSAMRIVPIASAGDDHGFLEEVQPRLSLDDDAAAGHGPAAGAVRQRRAVVINDVQADPRIRHKNAHVDRGTRSLAHLPVLVAGEPVAVFGLHAAEAGFFDEQEMKLLQELAGDIAFAIEHIEKEKTLAHLGRIQVLMGSIGSLMVRARDRDELFREACRIAVEAGGFRMSLICIVDRSVMKIVPVASAGKDEELLAAIKNTLSSSEEAPKSMVARAVREKKAVVANDSKSDPRVLFGTKYAEAGIRSIAVLPLIVADEALGVLALYAGEAGFFDEKEMRLLTELSGNIAFAIDHIETQERLNYLAYYDVLTGLANRSLFLDRVAQYIRGAASGGHKVAVFLADLERFKNLNDSLGRPAGDELLRQVAQWLTGFAGDANLVARVGADVFAVVLPKVRPGGDLARMLEKRIRAFLEHPFQLAGGTFRIAAKGGGALYPDDGADADTLYRNAEAALKKAKAGGERYLFYTQAMNEAVAAKLTMENQLREALEKREFVLHYQPKVNLASGKITGAEALIRWNDPRTGLVPPGRFIPSLEETGLIYDVGRWALRQAIADYLRWLAEGLGAVRIAVNVSPLQLRNRGFIDEIGQVIGIDARAPAGLELEITESLIMEDVKGTIASLQAIRDLGLRIAIDDFGTGFSSLSYLAKLPVDTLKIDRSFVIEMTTAPEGLALVSTIISLAHALKLKVVAEGVETEEQSRLLHLLGCDEMQGFLFSKPVPAEIFGTKFLVPPAAAGVLH